MERAGVALLVELGGGVLRLAQRGDLDAHVGEAPVERHGEGDLALPGHRDGVGEGALGVGAGAVGLALVGLVQERRGALGVAEEVGVEVGDGVVASRAIIAIEAWRLIFFRSILILSEFLESDNKFSKLSEFTRKTSVQPK